MSRCARAAKLLLVAFAFLAVSAQAASAKTALIDASTVYGGMSSQEAQIAQSEGFTVTIISDAQWQLTSQATFGSYDVLIAGDPRCGSMPSGLLTSSTAWAPVVMGKAGGRDLAGNRIVIGTDPVYHDGGAGTARAAVIRTGIAWAGKQPGTTGMYFDTSCGGSQGLAQLQQMSAGTGAWTEAAPPCGGSAAMIASNPAFADLTSASLQGWGCSVHEAYPTFPSDWSALAIATDTTTKPTCGTDRDTGANACGQAYVLIAGTGIVVTSGSIALTPTDRTDPVGGDHTVTANVTSGGSPLTGQRVAFSVTGQNAGVSGTCAPVDCTSDSSGNVSFTYHDANGAGDDTIKGSFTDARGSLQAATAQEHWVGVTEQPITATGTSIAATEGQTFSGRVATFTDPDTAAPITDYSASIDWGDGSTSAGTIASNGAGYDVNGEHVYTADGAHTVTVTVTDVDSPTNTATATTSADVADAAPSAALDSSNDLSVAEGSTHTYGFTTSDYDDSVSVATSCGANGTKVADTATSFTCSFADGPAGSDVSVTPTNANGTAGVAATQTVMVANVAPTVALDTGNDLSVGEGSTHNYSYSISDPGQDTVASVSTSCGDNGTKVSETNGDTSGTFSCSFADGPSGSTVSVQATDSDGAAGNTDTQAVDVRNIAPTVALDGGNPSSVDESKADRTFTYSISDPGQDTVQSVATSCGTGGQKTGESNTDSSGSFTCVFAHGPANPTVSVQATDSDGDAGNTDTQSVTVTDPAITATGSPVSGTEAVAFTGQKVASFTDPTGYATADEYSASIAWGDGSTSAGTIAKTGDGSFDVTGSHTYGDEGSYAVKVTITDTDNAANADTATSTATVGDAPIHAAGTALITTPAAYSGPVATFSDEAGGPKSDFSATVDWGDGATSTGTISGPDSGGTFTVSGSHTYATTGPFTITVKVSDVGGSTDSAKTSVLVYAFANADGGSFAISDKQAVQGASVTWWGAQWEKANPFSSGATGSASFKGFIEAPTSKTAPKCASTWTSGPGNSSAPPATVPAYMAVVVASRDSKSGSTISGDVKKIVVVKTAAGYANDPGHAGTGTVVGSVCG